MNKGKRERKAVCEFYCIHKGRVTTQKCLLQGFLHCWDTVALVAQTGLKLLEILIPQPPTYCEQKFVKQIVLLFSKSHLFLMTVL